MYVYIYLTIYLYIYRYANIYIYIYIFVSVAERFGDFGSFGVLALGPSEPLQAPKKRGRAEGRVGSRFPDFESRLEKNMEPCDGMQYRAGMITNIVPRAPYSNSAPCCE